MSPNIQQVPEMSMWTQLKVCHRGEDTIAVSMESTKQINVKLIAFITL